MKRGLLLVALLAASCGRDRIASYTEAGRRAATYPDYAGAVIPPNIAPLNLEIREPGDRYCLRVSAAAGAPVEVFGSSPKMRIPTAAWRALLQANAGGELRTDLYARDGGAWRHFQTIRDRVAREEIDPYVVYRYLPPVYDKWGPISIRQRDLASFDERIVFDNAGANGVCINCHTFQNHATDRMLLHVRPGGAAGQIPAMILVNGGRAEKVDARIEGKGAAAYASWHPSGRWVAFSRNSLLQIFHTAGVEVRDVIDRDSDLALYDVEARRPVVVPQIARPDRLESWPAWSADGRALYFSSARFPTAEKKELPMHYDKVRYDLARAAFDPATGRWGDAEIVVSSAALGRSVSLPVPSPDGRWLMFTGHDYGSFPIFQPSADLYLIDLRAGGPPRRLDELNSERADSYHSWSSNSRWVVFSSKREDGMFARLFLAWLGDDGRFGKPFVLPQEDPGFYGRCLFTFNRPELISKPVGVSAEELTRAIRSGAVDGPAGAGDEPYSRR